MMPGRAQLVVAPILALAGSVAAAIAIRNERRMQQHRKPGVTYAAATLRRDGGWRRSDLFTAEGLRYQRMAARFGLIATALWVVALGVWIALGV